MTRQIYIKLNMSALDFLILVLQSYNKFDLIVFFQVLLILIFTVYKGHVQLLFWGPVRFTGLPGLT